MRATPAIIALSTLSLAQAAVIAAVTNPHHPIRPVLWPELGGFALLSVTLLVLWLNHRGDVLAHLRIRRAPRLWDQWLSWEPAINAVYRESPLPLAAEPDAHVDSRNRPDKARVKLTVKIANVEAPVTIAILFLSLSMLGIVYAKRPALRAEI